MPSESKLTLLGQAPNFMLQDQTGNTVALSDYQGKKNVVLIFYPGDLTPGCTMQLCDIRDDWSKFQKTDTVVFGVNQGTAESHSVFSKKYGFPFTLLIDKDKKVSTKYGAVFSILRRIIIRRTVVVIDKTGKVVFLRRGMPKDADILKALNPKHT